MKRVLICFLAVHSVIGSAEEQSIDSFERQELTNVYYSEGANVGDFDANGIMDVVHGPYWFAGPDFKNKHEIYEPKAQNRQAYANSFFSWTYDFNQDGFDDVFAVGFPGTPAFVYENPGKPFGKHWKKHQVFDWVSNESPQFTNIVGDEKPELICTRDGFFGYVTVHWKQPFASWKFTPISAKVAPLRFGHGLGVGDVNGDQRIDVITKDGWFEQPAILNGQKWTFHSVSFAPQGGADMFAYDVDGDGDNDIITSLAAHDFGLAWYEQAKENGNTVFHKHLIMGDKAEDNDYGVLFTELHSVNLADVDNDGLKDIVTGKTFWSHHTKSPLWDAGAVCYWFKLVRTSEGVEWIPYQADDNSGIGRQLIVADLNGDQLKDVVVGGMKGCNVLIHKRKTVTEDEWLEAQPKKMAQIAAGLPPQQAAARMTVPPGFQVQLAAGEPKVHQPVGFAIDEKGRLWVAEAHTYPVRAPEGKGKDKIIILEDTNGDGVLDDRKVFIEGLNLVSGIEVGFGGVWIGAAPYLMFIPDQNHDDVPDSKAQILLDGFGFHDTHETLNAFTWGPDGWLYGCHGIFTHSHVGKPGSSDDQRIKLNAGVWRYHPIRHEFDVFARGTSNPWGVDFNNKGQAFITACVIPHLYHVIQGAKYQRQAGRHFNDYVFDDIKTIADHLHYVGNIRDHAWWGHEPVIHSTVSDAGGGHAHAGAMIYLGDNWPEKYRNQIYMCNIHGNRVNQDILQQRGSGYVGHHGRDLLLANDRWFRGINMAYGPDGGVFLIDWYDRNACHRVNPLIWDRTNGRIYKFTFGETTHQDVDLRTKSNEELLALHSHKNEWFVRMARKVLQEREANLADQIIKAFQNAQTESQKLRYLWTLHVTSGIPNKFASAALNDKHEHVRAWTIQLILENGSAEDTMIRKFELLAKTDPSPVVRLYLASALQKLPISDRWPIAANLIAHAEDANDHNLPLMYWYGMEPLVESDPSRAMELAADSRIPLVTKYILRRAASSESTLNAVVTALGKSKGADQQILILNEILSAFEGRVGIQQPAAWTTAFGSLSKSDHREIVAKADRLAVLFGDHRIFPKLRSVLQNNDAPMSERQNALDVLVRGRDQDAAKALLHVVSIPELQAQAIRALSAFDDQKIPELLISKYASLSEKVKRDAISTLISRPAFVTKTLDAIESGNLPRTDLHAYHVRQISSFRDATIQKRLDQVWGRIREASADKKKRIHELSSDLHPQNLESADLSNGRRLFNKTCATCHQLFDYGEKVGPDITGSNRANLAYILENVIDPSAVLGKDYRMTSIITEQGRVISGLIQKETDSALTVRTINDTLIVAKADINERTLSDKSLMPDGLLNDLTKNEIRDLIGYLASPTQVPLRGPKAPIDPKTNRVADAIEMELLKKVKVTQGSLQAQGMSSFSKDRWSNNSQLWWTGAKPGARLTFPMEVPTSGLYDLEAVFTRARDYGIIKLEIGDTVVSEHLDLFNEPEVITTGVLSFPNLRLDQGIHNLEISIIGANPQAIQAYMVGIDFVRLIKTQSDRGTTE